MSTSSSILLYTQHAKIYYMYIQQNKTFSADLITYSAVKDFSVVSFGCAFFSYSSHRNLFFSPFFFFALFFSFLFITFLFFFIPSRILSSFPMFSSCCWRCRLTKNIYIKKIYSRRTSIDVLWKSFHLSSSISLSYSLSFSPPTTPQCDI